MGLSLSLGTLGSQWDTPTLALQCPQPTLHPQDIPSYLSLWIWQSFTLSTLPSSSITSSLNWLLSSLQKTRKEQEQCFGEQSAEKMILPRHLLVPSGEAQGHKRN